MIGRLAGTVWRHSPFLVLLALAGALRAYAWFAVQPAWWILGDSISYLNDAVHLQPDRWRPSGYSVMLLRPLLPAHQLALVTAVQHLMGVLVGTLVYVTLLRLKLPRWVAALAAIPALFDGYVLGGEQMLASETLFSTLIVLALAFFLWRQDGPGLLAVSAAGLLLGLSATTRVVGLPLIGVAVVALLLRRPHWFPLVALCLAFALPVGAYAWWFNRHFHRVNITASSGIFMYGRTTRFVDCNRVAFSDEKLRSLCPTEPIGSRNEIFYVFDPNAPIHRANPRIEDANDLAGRFAVDALRAQPADYVALCWSGLVESFSWDQRSQPTDVSFQISEPLPPEARAAGYLYQGRDPGPVYQPDAVRMLAGFQSVASVTGTMCLLALVLAAAGLLLGSDPDRRGLRSAVLLTAGVAAVLLVVPALTAIPAPRYRVPAVPELGLAVALSAQLLANRIRARQPVARGERAERLPASMTEG